MKLPVFTARPARFTKLYDNEFRKCSTILSIYKWVLFAERNISSLDVFTVFVILVLLFNDIGFRSLPKKECNSYIISNRNS